MKSDIEVSFYSITNNNLDKSLAKLVEKIYGTNIRLLMKLKNINEVEYWDNYLWSYSSRNFLAHGSIYGPKPEIQPILITDQEDNLNQSNAVIIVNDVEHIDKKFEKIIYIFDQNNHIIEKLNNERIKSHNNAHHIIKYWQQDQIGTWHKLEKI